MSTDQKGKEKGLAELKRDNNMALFLLARLKITLIVRLHIGIFQFKQEVFRLLVNNK
jgi:hypothetical protein